MPGYRQELAATLHALGPVLAKRGRLAEGKEAVRRALLLLREGLAAAVPEDGARARELAESQRLLDELR